MLEAFLNIKTKRVIPAHTKSICHPPCLSNQCENYEKNFELWSQLQVAKGLIVRVQSTSYNVSRFEN